VVNLLKLIDYNVPGKQAATADEQFTLGQNPIDETVTIPRVTRLQSSAGTGGTPVKFETLAEHKFAYTTLTANASPTDSQITVSSSLEFEVGQTVNLRDDDDPASGGEDVIIEELPDSSTIKFATGITGDYTTAKNAEVSVVKMEIGVQEGTTYNDVVGSSSGMAWQVFAINRLPVIEGTVEVWVDETGTPEKWAEVESLAYATAGQKVYELSRNFAGYVIIRFGDGTYGKIPDAGASNVSSIFRVGGGVSGNVGADKITKLLDSISYSGGPVTFTVTNLVQSSGGAEEQSIEDAKFLGPKSLRALNRAVTLEDFAVLARTVAGVEESRAVLRGVAVYREIDVYIIPVGSYVPTQTLKDLVKAYLQERAMAGTLVYVNGPKHLVDILLIAQVTLDEGVAADAVQVAIETALIDFFSVGHEFAQFGKDVNLSDIMALVDNIDGVNHIDTSQLTLDPASVLTWEVAPDTGRAIVDYITPLNTLSLIDQTYTIRFTSDTQYDVENGIGATVLSGANLGTGYTLSDGALQIKLSANTPNNMGLGSRATFRTSQYIGNVEVEDFEIRQLGNMTLSFV